MNVVKRDGRKEPVSFDKITTRISILAGDERNPLTAVNPILVAQQTIASISDGISTSQLDSISADKAYELSITHNPQYAVLSSRILASNAIKNVPRTFSQHMAEAATRMSGRLDPAYCEWVAANAPALDAMIVDDRDYNFQYPGYRLLERIYLLSHNGAVFDRPQYMYMRVAVCVFKGELDQIKALYDALSTHMFTLATPTMINACTVAMQLNSCFLLGTSDSIEGIQDTKRDAAIISKYAGGVGIHMSNIRPAGTLIKSSGGRASGLVPQLKIYNEEARTWNQGGKRLGAFAIYLEPWHGDILRFLRLKQQTGHHEERARDLFYGLWVPDLFVRRVMANAKWSLFSETSAPHLSDVYDGMPVCIKCGHSINPYYNKHFADLYPGRTLSQRCADKCAEYSPKNVFTDIYERYESEGRAIETISPDDILFEMTKTQSESGTPYVCFKDHVNRQSNQQNIGTIKSSNLCTEIMEYSDSESYACCTLGSLNLPAYVSGDGFNFKLLERNVALLTTALDRIISVNRYPVSKCYNNAYKYRPIGIGVQGLASVFIRLKMPYLSPDAEILDQHIFRTIYRAALRQSALSAAKYGPYEGWQDSPLGRGKFRWQLWEENRQTAGLPTAAHGIIENPADWDELRELIAEHGLRHSLHVALMPTASTSIVLGNPESTEPWHSLIYVSTTIAGKFTVMVPELVDELIRAGSWNEKVRREIINNGSLMGITGIPTRITEIYKTVWEMPQTEIMHRAALRAKYIDQSQSLNIHVKSRNANILTSIFSTGWRLGLMTGSYYIRGNATASARKVAVRSEAPAAATDGEVCRPGCDSCSS